MQITSPTVLTHLIRRNNERNWSTFFPGIFWQFISEFRLVPSSYSIFMTSDIWMITGTSRWHVDLLETIFSGRYILSFLIGQIRYHVTFVFWTTRIHPCGVKQPIRSQREWGLANEQPGWHVNNKGKSHSWQFPFQCKICFTKELC